MWEPLSTNHLRNISCLSTTCKGLSWGCCFVTKHLPSARTCPCDLLHEVIIIFSSIFTARNLSQKRYLARAMSFNKWCLSHWISHPTPRNGPSVIMAVPLNIFFCLFALGLCTMYFLSSGLLSACFLFPLPWLRVILQETEKLVRKLISFKLLQ